MTRGFEGSRKSTLQEHFLLAFYHFVLHGRSHAQEECNYYLDKTQHTCVIDATTTVGNDLDCIFTVLAFKKYGVNAVNVEQIIWQKYDINNKINAIYS